MTTSADHEAQLWFGEDPTQLGVLLRTALATGADVQLVPHQSEQAPAEGVRALLHYADDSTPTS